MSSLPSHKTLAKSIIIFGGTQILTILAAIVRSKVAAITVGAMGLGLTSLYLTITSLINNICNLGIPDSGVQTLSKVYATGDKQNISNTIGLLRLLGVITAAVAMLIMIIASPLLCWIYFGSPMSHWHSIMVLSIVPACTIIAGIETVVLKSLQQTRRLTYTITASSIISVAVSIPLYFLMGWDGIIFIIVLTSLLTTLVTLYLSYSTDNTRPSFPLLRKGLSHVWHESQTIIMLGITLVITGIGSMGADLLLQTYITAISSLTIVGLYKAGYQLSITYPAMIFTAVNNDYYPRLAALEGDVSERNILATKQTRILLLIVTPCILLFIMLLRWIIPLMLSEEFLMVETMVKIGALSIIVRCATLPLAYMPLALGRKWDFVVIELISYLGLIVCIIGGCKLGELTGIGFGILASNVIDYIIALVLCRTKYGFRYTLR